jgi:arsenate reductase
MSNIRLYHNPNCSKSRGALALLEERGVTLEIVEYIDHPPTRGDLEDLVRRLPEGAATLVRHDSHFKSLELDPDAYTKSEDVIALLLQHPALMQRPIAVRGEQARIGRPPEKILELLTED